MRPLHLTLLFAIFSVLALAPTTALAGGGGGGGPCAGFASGSKLIMRDSCFTGVAHFAEAGASLEVYNEGEYPHSFTAVDGSFDSGLLEAGESVRIELGAAGLVPVYCVLHGQASGLGMAGLLVVGEPNAQAMGVNGGSAALTRQNEAVLTALEAQSVTLTDLRGELAAARRDQSVAARPTDPRPAQAAALGLLGALLGGSALAMVFYRRRTGDVVKPMSTPPPNA